MSRVLERLRVVTDADSLSAFDAAWSGHESVAILPSRMGVDDAWLARAFDALPDELTRGHFCVLTSGSTGRPKLVVGDKQRAERLVQVLHELQQSDAVAQTIVMLPLSYCYALINQWLWSREFERRLIMTPGLRAPDEIRSVLEQADSASLCLVGPQVPLLTGAVGSCSFPGVIRVHFAGGPFPQDRLADVRTMFPNARIFNNYGCTEALPRLTLRCAEESDDPANVGCPLPGIELETGEGGEILFRSPYRAVALCDDDGFTPVADADWLPSGDLGERLASGAWRLLGRSNEVFNRFGEKIALPQLLASIRGTWAGQAAFYREPDRSGEPGHVLLLSPEPDEPSLRRILKELRAHYRRPHWPIRIEAVATIPMLANGKIDTTRLRELPDRTTRWEQRI